MFFRRRRRRLALAIEQSVQAITKAGDVLREATQARAYLQRSQLDAARKPLAEAAAALEPASRRRFLGKALRAMARAVASRLEACRRDLDGYNGLYEKRELAGLETWLAQHGMQLTPEQKLAVVRDDRRNLVVAAAGSGKTDVLVHRVAHLVRKGVAPERILAITFTRPAKAQMKERLETKFGITDVDVRTFNSLGYRVVREARDSNPRVVDKRDLRRCIEQTMRAEAQAEGPFLRDLLAYLSSPDIQAIPQEAEFPTKEAFYQTMRDLRYVTLRGDHVRSLAEKQISDFLTVNQVPHQYERIHDRAQPSKGRRHYRPDFTLDDGIVIEHWTVRPGTGQQVPSWFDWTTEEYLAKMKWAHDQFAAGTTRLVETYSDEFYSGDLERVLREQLTRFGVRLRPMAYRDLVERVYEFHHLESQVMDLFETWIKNAKVLGLKPADIPARLEGEPARTQAFGRCGIRLLEAYEEFLGKKRLVDYSDMIHEAIRHMEPRPQDYGRRYDHVLVDEFQDVSKDKVDLLQQLLTGDAHLFCVGDDWQSIFSFAGSDVKFFREFEAWFGPATATMLPDSFRCPAGVIEAGNRLMAYNKGQMPKQVVPRSTARALPVLRPVADGQDYRQAVTWHARLWVHSLTDHGTAAKDLMVLSRYRAPLAALAGWLRADGIPLTYRDENEEEEKADDGVVLQTIHKAKGGQAKHVLVLDVSEGGIPSLVEDPAVLSPVRLAALAPLEEERRLFYVALTRCQQSLTLQGCPTRLSRFVQELALPPQSFRPVAAAAPLARRS